MLTERVGYVVYSSVIVSNILVKITFFFVVLLLLLLHPHGMGGSPFCFPDSPFYFPDSLCVAPDTGPPNSPNTGLNKKSTKIRSAL